MRKLTAILATALVAAGLAIPAATPAAAQGFSFHVGSPGPSWHRWERPRWDRWDRPSYRNRNSIEFRLGPITIKGRLGHVERCKAKYRSYNAATDMYKTYGGKWRYCRL